jgi:hypothetical protein
MFVRYFVELPLASEIVAERLEADPQTWLPPIAGSASDRGNALLAEVGFGERPRIARRVVIETGPVARLGGTTVLPLTWKASNGETLFPRLTADLEVAALLPTRTQLAISAVYEPPLGLVGRTADRALLHRVAEATLKDFLDRVAARLAENAVDVPPAPVSR